VAIVLGLAARLVSRWLVDHHPAADDHDDGPAAVVRAAAHLMSNDEAGWALAMVAEVPHVRGRVERWSFALGCLRTALFIPVRHPALLATIVGLAVADAAALAWALVRFAGLRADSGTGTAVTAFLAVLLLYTLGAAVLIRHGGRGSTGLVHIAFVGGLVIAATWVGLGFATALDSALYGRLLMLVCFPLVCLTVGAVGTWRAGAAAVGRQGVLLAATLAGLASFFVWTAETVARSGRPYGPGLQDDFHTSRAPDLATYAVSDSLGSAMMLMLTLPLLTVAIGFLAASLTGRLAARPS
jgi:hypothetical protein